MPSTLSDNVMGSDTIRIYSAEQTQNVLRLTKANNGPISKLGLRHCVMPNHHATSLYVFFLVA